MRNLKTNETIKRGRYNCPCCGGEMPKAEHYKGLFVYQMGKCDKCKADLVSSYGYDDIDGWPTGDFFWECCQVSKTQECNAKG